MKKIDLHTHSYASKDGGLRPLHYHDILESGQLDVVAVTDHNRIDAAVHLHNELGDQIIIGEEISTKEGDIIGLYLTEMVPAGLAAAETAEAIHRQGGLVYVPHPFDQFRRSTGHLLLERIQAQVDIIETYNGRMMRNNQNKSARKWAAVHNVPGAASSDAHGWSGWGGTYTIVDGFPAATTLLNLLQRATFHESRPSIRAKLYPAYNRMKHRLGHA